jgi:hypothetical protein
MSYLSIRALELIGLASDVVMPRSIIALGDSEEMRGAA